MHSSDWRPRGRCNGGNPRCTALHRLEDRIVTQNTTRARWRRFLEVLSCSERKPRRNTSSFRRRLEDPPGLLTGLAGTAVSLMQPGLTGAIARWAATKAFGDKPAVVKTPGPVTKGPVPYSSQGRYRARRAPKSCHRVGANRSNQALSVATSGAAILIAHHHV